MTPFRLALTLLVGLACQLPNCCDSYECSTATNCNIALEEAKWLSPESSREEKLSNSSSALFGYRIELTNGNELYVGEPKSNEDEGQGRVYQCSLQLEKCHHKGITTSTIFLAFTTVMSMLVKSKKKFIV